MLSEIDFRRGIVSSGISSYRFDDFGFRILGFGLPVSGFGFRDSGFGFRVPGFGFLIEFENSV